MGVMLESSIGGRSYFLRCERRALDGSQNAAGGRGGGAGAGLVLVWPLEDPFSVLLVHSHSRDDDECA